MKLPVDRNVSTTDNAEDGQDKIPPANLLALQDLPVKAQPPACPYTKMSQWAWTSCLNRGNPQHSSMRQKGNIIMTKKRKNSKYGGGFWNGNVLQESAHRLVMWGACHLILDKKSHKRHHKHKDTSMKTGCRQIIQTAYFATWDSQLQFPILSNSVKKAWKFWWAVESWQWCSHCTLWLTAFTPIWVLARTKNSRPVGFLQ